MAYVVVACGRVEGCFVLLLGAAAVDAAPIADVKKPDQVLVRLFAY
jgi:hypothetical protein